MWRGEAAPQKINKNQKRVAARSAATLFWFLFGVIVQKLIKK
ncbi:hypothetical protein APA_5290 [Pseudanabaena sp. lw0831]|nr:hypothetical protein APA_5290 [Pseudanabaena sp. lw0831]